jgi:hypothetical protein
MRRQAYLRRDGTASVLATMLLVVALVAQTILGTALQLRAAEPNAGFDAVLCLSQPGTGSHGAGTPAGQPRHSADCLAFCQLSASGPAAPLALASITLAPAGPATKAPLPDTRGRFVLNVQAFLAAARAPPSPSA